MLMVEDSSLSQGLEKGKTPYEFVGFKIFQQLIQNQTMTPHVDLGV